MDQQEVLKWVQRSIRSFGGDPDNVTLFGESAGGLATLFNMVSPLAAGLFHRAILQSGVSAAPQTPLEAGFKLGIDFATALGCTDEATAAVCIRSKSVAEIIEKAERFTGIAMRVLDGAILPEQMQKRLADGNFHRVPILIGNNHNEWTWFVSLRELATRKPLAREDYVRNLAGTFGAERAAKIATEYPVANFPSASEAVAHALTSWGFVCPSRRVMASASKYVPVYVYEFMDKDAPQYFDPVSFPYGAAHTLEIQYIFPRYHGAEGKPKPLNAAQQELSDAMVRYWTDFAAKGDPNGRGVPAWPKWMMNSEQTQLLHAGKIATAKDLGVDRKCGFWDAL